MIRIAIVEDEKVYAEEIAGYCRRYSAEKKTEISSRWFDNPVDFLEKYRGDVELVFMDVLMPLMDGMTCAKRLRMLDEDVLLCFVTSVAQYAINGYEVGALDFMVKPVSFDEFSMKMDRILRLLRKRGGDKVLISSRNAVRNVSLRDLYCVEVYNHSLVYHTSDGDYEAYGKLSALEEDPRFSGFVRISPSHLVNASRIDEVKEECVVVHGTRIPISRRRRKECMNRIAALLGGIGI